MRVRMASKTTGAAEKMNGGSDKMEDMAVKTDEAAKKWKTISKEDGECGEEVEDYRQRRRRMSATNLRQCRRSSGQGLRNFLRKRTMCKWSQNKLLGMAENATMAAVFLEKCCKNEKKRTERIDFTNNRITLHIINIGATYNQYRRAYKRNKQNFKFLALYQQTASTNKETENN